MAEGTIIQIVCTVLGTVVSPAMFLLLGYVFKGRKDRQGEEERRAEESRILDSRMSAMGSEIMAMNMLLLKCVITNKELSRQARLDAYDKYKKLGGNS
jgi:Mn2+/Fe2+ NRAMP family transporter